jgi:hypothetical protein
VEAVEAVEDGELAWLVANQYRRGQSLLIILLLRA